MSFTRTVPAAVPSLFQSPVGSSVAKKSVPFTFVRLCGFEPLLPGLMSFTSTVPAAVPSLFQSSSPSVGAPFAGSEAWKKSVPFTSVSPSGYELTVATLLMSFTRYGPACPRAGPTCTAKRKPARSKHTGHVVQRVLCSISSLPRAVGSRRSGRLRLDQAALVAHDSVEPCALGGADRVPCRRRNVAAATDRSLCHSSRP